MTPLLYRLTQLHLYYAPFDSLLPYTLLGLVLSGIILLCLQVLHMVQRRYPILMRAFTSMLQVHKHRLRCFNVDVTLEQEGRRIRSRCLWTLRLAVVVVLCFLWQSIVLFQVTAWVETPSSSAITEIEDFCRIGLRCFRYERLTEVLFRWTLLHRAEELCSDVAGRIDRGYATCVGIPRPGSLTVAASVAVSYAMYRLILVAFQFVAWLVFRSEGRAVELTLVVLSVLSLIFYLVAMFLPWGFFYDAWFTSVTYLSLPVILLTGRAVGASARCVLQRRLLVRPPPRDDFQKLHTLDRGIRSHSLSEDFGTHSRSSRHPSPQKTV